MSYLPSLAFGADIAGKEGDSSREATPGRIIYPRTMPSGAVRGGNLSLHQDLTSRQDVARGVEVAVVLHHARTFIPRSLYPFRESPSLTFIYFRFLDLFRLRPAGRLRLGIHERSRPYLRWRYQANTHTAASVSTVTSSNAETTVCGTSNMVMRFIEPKERTSLAMYARQYRNSYF